MKAEELQLDELIRFSSGLISLQGRRLILHDIRAFAHLRKDLLEGVGPVPARKILTRFGYIQGQADAAAMKRIFEWDNLEEWLRAGPAMQSLQGLARVTIDAFELDEAEGYLHMGVTWRDSFEAAEFSAAFGEAEAPACWIQTGYASGYASFCLGKEVVFIEDQCLASGKKLCRATGRDVDSWDQKLELHREYFQEVEIGREVRKLSEELKQSELRLARQRRRMSQLENKTNPSFFEVHSTAFEQVVDLAARVSRYDSSVVITGESGVGKEVLARYIHRSSKRSENAFVAVNCAALPETLLDSELFGHKAGSFTGAQHDRIGLFEEADGGTVFLDEIGDIPLALQMKLLRVLQEREIVRVGENRPRKVDVRILAATNSNLAASVQSGSFREDLYYRLRVIEIEIPPLRERPEDILPLARYFVNRISSRFNKPDLHLDAKCVNYLQAYRWPGNVRELENAMERAVVLCSKGVILPEHLPPYILHPARDAAPDTFSPQRTLAEVEQEHILRVLDWTGGNKSRTARTLGISPATLWRKLKDIEKKP
ncbi:sigma-54-dependent Fis family transcriptional regulator [Verrucomicrobia bacterium S94]|nr:sigma-54-dependent Fis family transcriptional regulator [Verrucomicrobia bacterium S94]